MEEEVIIEVHLFGDNANLLKGLAVKRVKLASSPCIESTKQESQLIV